MNKVIKNILIVAVIAGLGIVGYSFFKKEKAVDTGLSTTGGLGATAGDTLATENAVGREFLSTLLNIRSIKLDESIFENKTFLSLQDFSRKLEADTNPGRSNPFAPLGADTSAVSTQVSTSNPSSVTTTTTTLNATITLGGPEVTRWFEYGTTNSLGTQTTPKTQANPGAFAETITGLTPNTTYYVKAVASIGGTAVAGNLVTWKTAQSTGTTPAVR